VEVDKKNDGDVIDFVTTGDFKVKDIKTDKYLTEAATRKIFPPNSLTRDFIDLCRLRPRISDDIAGEHLKFTCLLDIGTAQQDNAFNVVATCSYGFTPDSVKIKKLLNDKKTEFSKTEMTKEDIEFALKDWSLLEAKRHFIQNSFDFIIETVGPFSNSSIIYKACDIMINKLRKFQNTMNNQQDLISNSNTTIVNGYDITIPNEGYTLGKVIEYVLYSKYYGSVLTYCGFQKPHPHIDICKIRLGFKDPIEISNIVTYLVDVAEDAIKVYEKIMGSFKLE
jgi:DNA-directed RNA polymerase subunit L